MKDEIRKRFIAYQDEWMKDLAALIAIDSSGDEPTEGCPFGDGPAKALHTALEMGERMGFVCDNVDNYAGTLSYGDSEDSIGVVAHLDVVPAGTGWETDPFKLTVKDDVLYGRGVIDDKGPFISALYGMRILKDMGLPLSKTIRVIFGTNEEKGSGCMKYYNEHRVCPPIGFTPDADYPLIHGEKGGLWAELHFPAEDTPILDISAGEAFNAVISECRTILDGKKTDADALRSSIIAEDSLGYPVAVSTNSDGNVELLVKGLAAHGSTPELGVNALVSTANILCRYLGDAAGKLMWFLKDELGRDPNAVTLGLFAQDEPSGKLTLNVGRCEYHKDVIWIGNDIRYPVTMTLSEMKAKYTEMTEKYGLSFVPVNCSEPLYVPKDNPVVQSLLGVYREVSGKPDADAFVIGGGTYAKEMRGDYVAFGPELPDRPGYNIHTIGENITLEEMINQAVICTMAMYELAK